MTGELEMRAWHFGKPDPAYSQIIWQQALGDLRHFVGIAAESILGEPPLAAIATEVKEGIRKLQERAPIELEFNADWQLAECCYLLCRLIKPSTVVETGVALGVTSAFILQALAVSGAGHLHSVDLAPLANHSEAYVGCLIPLRLKERWSLYRGSSRRRLPQLFRELESIDLFIHDSLHSYRNMQWEFLNAFQKLRLGGGFVADDVGFNRAFLEFQPNLAFSRVVKASTTFAFGFK